MIALFTDFGLSGPYTGQVKAVLHQLAPAVPIVDLFADLPARQPKPAAYLLAAYGLWFPPGTVLVAGRRSWSGQPARRLSSSKPTGAFMSAPTMACSRSYCAAPPPPTSPRSCGAPSSCRRAFTDATCLLRVAARLARGALPLGALGSAGIGRYPDWPDDLPEIVYIDGFGNAMTGLRAAILSEGTRARHRRTGSAARPHLFRCAAGHGLLVRERERARRDRCQQRSRRHRVGSRRRHPGLGVAVTGSPPVATRAEWPP